MTTDKKGLNNTFIRRINIDSIFNLNPITDDNPIVHYASTLTIPTAILSLGTVALQHTFLCNYIDKMFPTSLLLKTHVHFEMTKSNILHAHGYHVAYKKDIPSIKTYIKLYPYRSQFKRLVKDDECVKWHSYINKGITSSSFHSIIK